MMTPTAAPFSTRATRITLAFERSAAVWLALFAAAIALGPELLAWAADLGFALNAHGHAQLHPHGHPFADTRSWLGIPNAADVLSNLPFAVVAACGVVALRGAALPAAQARALCVVFWGLAITACASSAYHASPGPWGLVVDRLGMGVAFAGVLALAVALKVGDAASRVTLAVLLPLAACAAALAHTQGNVLPWALVQFGGVAALCALACMKDAPTSALRVDWLWVLAGYAMAKCAEMHDSAVFDATCGIVSGHTLKHLIAAAAAWPLVGACRASPLHAARS